MDDSDLRARVIARRTAACGWTRAPARTSVTIVLVVLALAIGVGGGLWIGSGGLPFVGVDGAAAGSGSGAGAEPTLYTCGMHPTVLQAEPGDCPICHMKLTPVREDESGDGAEADGGASGLAAAPVERKVLYWRAPMDPNYVSDRPGKSPMGMDLVPVYADASEPAAGSTVRIDPVTVQNMGIRTATVTRGPLVKEIRTVGRVAYDEQTVTFITPKFDGWIEKLYVDETGARIEKGQPLFDVYSPKLYAAQEEYLAALRGVQRLSDSTMPQAREEAQRLVDAAEVQLRYFDIADVQIDEMRRSGESRKTLTIHTPAGGVVTEKMALDGMYVQPGMRLYTVADLSRVWVLVDVYEYQLPWLRVGQQASMTLPYIPGRAFEGRVVYIYPYLEQRTRVVKVRLEFDNPDLDLKPDMFANVVLQADLDREALLVPREAYIDSGLRKVAFVVRGQGRYQPRDIQVGVEAENGMVEVRYGLDAGESVVSSGQFMLDAESKLKEAVAKMRMRDGSPSSGAAKDASTDAWHRLPAGEITAWKAVPHNAQPAAKHEDAGSGGGGIPPDAAYACPMDKHPAETEPTRQGAYFSAEPGRCPWCGMTLKPLDQLDWAKTRRAAGDGEIAYTCPDHPHVFSPSAGNCPRCDRPLEPFKVMYTCRDAAHASYVSAAAGACPQGGELLAPFRGVWLSEAMASKNVPPDPGIAAAAVYHCPLHPLVSSSRGGHCTICAHELETDVHVSLETPPSPPLPAIPNGANYVCPMESCHQFSNEPGDCPVCGMTLKPIEEVQWASALRTAQTPAPTEPDYVCPMHPDQHSADASASCPVCGMRLVAADVLPAPAGAPEAIAVQINYLMEHYLELQARFSSDRTADVALHALGLVGAADETLALLDKPEAKLPSEFAEAVRALRAAALKTTGKDLDDDRVTFAQMGAAMETLVRHVRPDPREFPDIYIYHCPMTKADWLQTSEPIANPFYGFRMLKCGTLVGKK